MKLLIFFISPFFLFVNDSLGAAGGTHCPKCGFPLESKGEIHICSQLSHHAPVLIGLCDAALWGNNEIELDLRCLIEKTYPINFNALESWHKANPSWFCMKSGKCVRIQKYLFETFSGGKIHALIGTQFSERSSAATWGFTQWLKIVECLFVIMGIVVHR